MSADGKLAKETWKADPNAPIDCFYVYPTISTDPGQNSDMTADPAEINVIKQQFARFASKCRPYAPLYRQITLVGLRKMLAPGATLNFGEGVQYDDVRDAWNYYLKNDNKGRGVVLVAHSQGSFILIDLIRREIDGKPIQSKLVSAILHGHGRARAEGQGRRRRIPAHPAVPQRVADRLPHLVCLVPFDDAAAGEHALRQVPDANMAAACVNPAALAGGSGELHAYLSSDGRTITGTTKPKPWVITGTADRHTVGQRARPPDCEMCVERQRVRLSRGDGQRQPVRSAC